ncbi:Acylphosphatase [Anatilimnocola aggregata]|uniref:acylphosphatase n=1 Tax=Anatilimnocola aggregata TaxID=2528021 RepID=A0A517YC83_9BACT|nr:acylphosphatase [Anatilimnocola aggregata]QDU27856.1 Acylphosphatase [Anatilimnocola aggregata]
MSAPTTAKQYEVYYSGRVQGVGFRANARHISRRYVVTGFVRNLPDGRVHLLAEGEKEHVEQFLADIADSMAGNITAAHQSTAPASGKYVAFSIA